MSAEPPRSTRILVAEDEPQIRHYVLEILADDPALEVVCVPSGELAIEKIQSEPWDIVVTDQRMGVADGVDVLRTAATLQPEAKRVMMTGFPELPLIASAKNVGGVHRFLAKPFSPTQFRDAVGGLLDEARARAHRTAAFARASERKA